MEELLIIIIGLLIIFGSMALIHYSGENKRLQKENDDLIWECIDLSTELDQWRLRSKIIETAEVNNAHRNVWDKKTIMPLTPARGENKNL